MLSVKIGGKHVGWMSIWAYLRSNINKPKKVLVHTRIFMTFIVSTTPRIESGVSCMPSRSPIFGQFRGVRFGGERGTKDTRGSVTPTYAHQNVQQDMTHAQHITTRTNHSWMTRLVCLPENNTATQRPQPHTTLLCDRTHPHAAIQQVLPNSLKDFWRCGFCRFYVP